MVGDEQKHMTLLALPALALAASCALAVPDYGLDQGSGAGGAGGAAATSGTTSGALAADGAPCGSDGECANGHCLPSNTDDGLVCCATACPDLGAASCGTNGKCDAHGGSCALYSAGTACGDTSTCADGMLTSMQCQMGACEHVASPCPGGLVCDDATTCKTVCITSADCEHPDAECPGGECIQPDGSPCNSDEQCMSGICGTSGTGHCCTAACDPIGDPCGAADCGLNGACVFPDSACGDSASCVNATLTSNYCNGMGECGSGPEADACPDHLVCEDANNCWASCGSNDTTGDARCTQGWWCDGAACQPASVIPGFPCSRGAQCASGVCTALGCFL